MAINVNEIDDFSDEVFDGTEQFEEVPDPDQDMYSDEDFEQEDSYYNEGESDEDTSPSEDIILDEFLKSKGINPRSIKFETEDGIEEKDFNDLDKEE